MSWKVKSVHNYHLFSLLFVAIELNFDTNK